MRILVAGGTGFLGRPLVAELRSTAGGDAVDGVDEVLVLSRGGGVDDGPIRHLALPWNEASRSRAVLDFAPDVLVNLVGGRHPRSSVGHEVDEVADQVLPFLRLVEALEPRGLERVVFASSAGSIYRSAIDPVEKAEADTPYHATKRSIEHYLAARAASTGLTAVSLRISNPVGDLDRPGFGIVGHFSRAVARGLDVDFVGDYATPKDYIDLADVASALRSVTLAPSVGPGAVVLDVGSGWAVNAPGMHKLIRSLAENGPSDPADRWPPDHGFTASSLDLEPIARLTGWTPSGDLIGTIEAQYRLQVEREAAGPAEGWDRRR